MKSLCLIVLFSLFLLPIQAQESNRVLAVSAIPALEPPPTIWSFIAAAEMVVDAGVTGNMMTEGWSKLEPQPGEYTLDDFIAGITYWAETYEVVGYVGFQVINTVTREVPPDLQGAAWDSPQMIARFQALIDQLRPTLQEHVRYVSIGNEVDAYLSSHPDEWEPYRRFYEAALAYIHRTLPGIQVGVTGTWQGALTNRDQMTALNRRSDVYILTYYPLQSDFSVMPPDSPLADFPTMLDLAGDLPLLLQEVGYPAGESLGSSESQQAEFVTQVFAAWEQAGERIPFLNYFLLHDFSDELTEGFVDYYGLPGFDNFYDFLRTLGLRQVDGTPRLAWDAFVEGAKSLEHES